MAAADPAKFFVVTGPPGVGKTTLVMGVVERLRASTPNLSIRGFYTREIREGSERVGFEVVTVGGRRGPLASTTVSSGRAGARERERERERERALASNSTSKCCSSASLGWPSVGKYKVDVTSFESLALPELQVKEGTDIFIIDEVGKMELYSSSFFPAVMRVLESNIPVLASIPVPKYGRDIPEVARLRNHTGVMVFTLNRGNRDSMREHIYSQMANLLQMH